MFTEVEEIAPDIFRLSTHIEDIAPPAGFTFNQFLVHGDEPFLFHTGVRGLFPLVSETVNRIVPVTDLRWISFAHVEADECGAMNDFLAVRAQRAGRARRVRGAWCRSMTWPTVPRAPWATMRCWTSVGTACGSCQRLMSRNWESGLWFDETTETLFAGDLFTHIGKTLAVTSDDIVEPTLAGEEIFHSTSLGPNVFAPTMRRLAALKRTTLATMHRRSYRGNGAQQLEELARGYATIVVDEAA